MSISEKAANLQSLDHHMTGLWAAAIGMQTTTPDPVFDLVRARLAEIREAMIPHIARIEMGADDAGESAR